MIETTIGVVIDEAEIAGYFDSLVNKIFKILPIIENREESITVYMESLGVELQGFRSLIPPVGEDPSYLSLLSIFKWLSDNVADSDNQFKVIRREVFHAISLCKKMHAHFLHLESGV